MHNKDKYIKLFYNEVCNNLGNNYKIIVESKRILQEKWIEYDTVKWEMEEPVKNLVDKLLINNNLTLEEKILEVYNFICLNYIYDANVLYFFKKDLTDPTNIKYIAADWYGRIVDSEWINNRKKHNRRICYEFSRFYAKAINTLIDNKYDLEAFMLGDIENTHYVVGLTGKDYSVIFDQDDFNGIKDLTRIKLGLTIKGINILRDDSKKFETVLDSFNKNRKTELHEIEEAEKKLKNTNLIEFFNTVVNIINKYNIDSQGFFEYVRNIIEKSNIIIEKIWRVDKLNIERRYERCLYFEYKNNTYLLDSIDKKLSIVNLDKLDKNQYIFNSEENTYKYYGG